MEWCLIFTEDIKKKYPTKILAEREYPETLIMCCILSDLTMLEDYEFKDNDFLSVEYNILFNIAKRLRKEGYNSTTQLEIKGKLSEKEREFFKKEEIWRILSDYEETANKDNFNDYVDKLYKNNIYLRLIDLGFDLFSEMEFEGKKIIPFNTFRTMTSQDVKEFYEYHINEFSTVDVNKGIEEGVVDITDEYLEKTMEGEAVGTLFDVGGVDVVGDDIVAFPTISQESNGFIDGSLSMLAGYSNVGKSTYIISMVMAMVHRGEKVVICSNEQREKPFIDNFVMWVLVNKMRYTNIDKNKLKAGRKALSDEDVRALKKAQEIWRKDYMDKVFFISLPNSNMTFVQKKFRQYYLRNGCTFFVYDTFKIDFSRRKENFWLGLVEDSRLLAEFANRYNTKVFATMQCALHTQGQLFLDASVLSNSKQVKEILQNLFIMRTLYKEEMDKESKFYCNPYTVTCDETSYGADVRRETEYVLDPRKKYRVIFLDKLREGETSEEGNYAVLVEFEGKYGTMKEVCLCRPKRMNINAVQGSTTTRK